jgi:hypothetical protein
MLVYNALTMPLVISFVSLALLWRNQQEGVGVPGAVADRLLPGPVPATAGPVRAPGALR